MRASNSTFQENFAEANLRDLRESFCAALLEAYENGEIVFETFLTALEKVWPYRSTQKDLAFFGKCVWQARSCEKKKRTRGSPQHSPTMISRAREIAWGIKHAQPGIKSAEQARKLDKILRKVGLQNTIYSGTPALEAWLNPQYKPRRKKGKASKRRRL